ncbi:MAG: ribosome biogenesis GTP-binding protein YihA/YsxC [Eubacterium sp.]|jgi:GTP-binding protein
MFNITSAVFETAAVNKSGFPKDGLPEIVFTGRSNVGKSSLLNFLCNRRNLARVSAEPGKTRTINYYLINESFRFVDLPGYGYAKIARDVTDSWGSMMDEFFENSENIKGAVLLVDIRHEPTKLDIMMYDYLRAYGLHGIVAATKADKVSGNVRAKNIAVIRKTLALSPEDLVIPVSSLKKTGKADLLDAIENRLKVK